MASKLEKEFTSLLRSVEAWTYELNQGAEWSGEISVKVAVEMREEAERIRALNLHND